MSLTSLRCGAVSGGRGTGGFVMTASALAGSVSSVVSYDGPSASSVSGGNAGSTGGGVVTVLGEGMSLTMTSGS
eukprot:3081976-Rhodomonas_salina.1